jgi:hypothetical protein
MAWLNVTNRATSLLMISAKIRSAVPICCSPPLSVTNPARISVLFSQRAVGAAALDCG